MEYEKLKNVSDNTLNYPLKSRARNCVEKNNDSGVMYSSNNQIKLKTTMVTLRLCDYSDL